MYNVSFLGLKENIEYGRQAINDVKKEFPNGFISNTYYNTFVEPVKDDVLFYYEDLVVKTRDLVDFKKRQGLDKTQATLEAVKLTGAANCGEQALLVSQELNKNGIQNKIISMDICLNSKSHYVMGGHTFCVIDTDINMDVKNPKTWGKNAVIVDMWSNTVAKVDDAIEFFKTFLKPKDNEHFEFNSCIYY